MQCGTSMSVPTQRARQQHGFAQQQRGRAEARANSKEAPSSDRQSAAHASSTRSSSTTLRCTEVNTLSPFMAVQLWVFRGRFQNAFSAFDVTLEQRVEAAATSRRPASEWPGW